jgi:hypothetical protein
MPEIKTFRRFDSLINNYEHQRMLQNAARERAKAEMRRMYRKRMLINGVLFFVAAMAIFTIIWWCGL